MVSAANSKVRPPLYVIMTKSSILGLLPSRITHIAINLPTRSKLCRIALMVYTESQLSELLTGIRTGTTSLDILVSFADFNMLLAEPSVTVLAAHWTLATETMCVPVQFHPHRSSI